MAIPQELLDDLAERRERAACSAETSVILDALFEPGTFNEYGRYADHALPHTDHTEASLPGDGVTAGVGYVGGTPVAAFAQSLSVAGGSVGRVHADRIVALLDHAGKAGLPVVGFLASLGGRLDEGMEALAGYGAVLNRMAALSGVVPQIAAVVGPCPGIGAMIPGFADFVIMVRGRSALYMTGPEVIESVAGFAPTTEEIGGAATHSEVSGLAHFVVEDSLQAATVARQLVGFLPPNNLAPPPDRDAPALETEPDAEVNALAPGALDEPFDVRPIVRRLVDDGDFLEIHAAYGTSIMVGLGRIGGLVTGIVASQPLVRAGVLGARACDKVARFVGFCDAFGLPVVTLVDAPGFHPGADQERVGLARHAGRLAFAYAEATVPKVTVVMRKAFGGAFLALGSRALGADVVYAWPTADIGLTGGDGEANVAARYPAPYLTDGRMTVADVIEPSRTRATVAMTLRTLAAKREMRPPRKHGTLAP